MDVRIVVPGGGELLEATPRGAVRRTMTTQVIARDGDWARGARFQSVGRDLIRGLDGSARVEVDGFAFDVDPADVIVPIAGESTVPEELRGVSARRGLRKRVAELRAVGCLADCGPSGGLCDALLDEVPGVLVVGGYGRMYDEVADAPPQLVRGPAAQVCVGFDRLAASGEPFTSTRFLSKAPSAEFVPADDLAWHHDPMPPNGAVRRRRLLQVRPFDGQVEVVGYFRDTFRRPDGVEVVIHEYGISAMLGGSPLVVEALEAHPGRLPMEHCPLAAVGTSSVIGTPMDEIDGAVRGALRGPRSCTHLNDELRSLRLVPVLMSALAG